MMAAVQPVATWRWLAVAAALLGFSAVLLGAAGSHAIDLSAATAAQRWDTALQIHYFQAAALLALAAFAAARSAAPAEPHAITGPDASAGVKVLLLSGWVQALGTVVFCGSLYLRVLQIEALPGWITPMGGLVLLSGWLLLLLALVGPLMRKEH
jgi:uncharacterized membrane protein YgdD (TMEM256/DUF423 family)